MTYRVINVETGESHGDYDTPEEARGCVAFDHIKVWEIWDDADQLVDYGVPWRTKLWDRGSPRTA